MAVTDVPNTTEEPDLILGLHRWRVRKWKEHCEELGELQWPGCCPPQPGVLCESFSNGYEQYKRSEVSPGRWQWVVDEDAMEASRRYETRRRNLYWALRSRVLSEEEMAEVGRWGDRLNIEPMVSYSAPEKARELNDALLQQFRLRAAAMSTEKASV